MAAKGGGGGGGGDQEYTWIALGVIFALFLFLGVPALYLAHKDGVNSLFLIVSEIELSPFALVFPRAREALYLIQRLPPADYSWVQVEAALTIGGQYLRWVIAPLMLLGAFVFYRAYGWVEAFVREFNMKTLLLHNARRFHLLAPVAFRKGGSLLNEPTAKGPWRVAESPMLFALRHQIIRYQKKNVEKAAIEKWFYQDNGLPRGKPHIPDGGVTFDAEMALTVFSDNDHMGPLLDIRLFRNVEYPAYLRGLTGAFCAMALGHRKAGESILDAMSTSFNEESAIAAQNVHGVPQSGFPLNILTADAWIARALKPRPADASSAEDNLQSQLIAALSGHDMFLYVWMGRLLEVARAHAGSIPPSEFIWLRPANRPLWYFLASLGGNACHTEGAGPWSHYRAEQVLKRPIPTPVVDNAVKALESAIESEGWFDLKDAKK